MNIEEFMVSNGTYQIYGIRYIPECSKNIPIVACHGFLSNAKAMAPYAESLCLDGYTVYCFDYCGGSKGGKSEGDYSYMTIEHELLDMEAILHYVKEDKKKLILLGESQGGFMSLLYASKNPQEVAKILCLCPALCIPDDARSGKMLKMKFDPKNIRNTFKSDRGYSFTSEFAEEAILIDVDKMLKNVSCPVCIVNGAKDPIVPASYGRRALENLSNTSFVYFIPKAKHGFKGKDIETALQYFKEFLK